MMVNGFVCTKNIAHKKVGLCPVILYPSCNIWFYFNVLFQLTKTIKT